MALTWLFERFGFRHKPETFNMRRQEVPDLAGISLEQFDVVDDCLSLAMDLRDREEFATNVNMDLLKIDQRMAIFPAKNAIVMERQTHNDEPRPLYNSSTFFDSLLPAAAVDATDDDDLLQQVGDCLKDLNNQVDSSHDTLLLFEDLNPHIEAIPGKKPHTHSDSGIGSSLGSSDAQEVAHQARD